MLLLAVPHRDRVPTRLTMLLTGLVLYGLSSAMLVLAGLGLDPWDVLHQGLARSLGGQIGTWSIAVGALVLLAWIPLRQRPGIGTLTNVVVVGLTIDATLAVVPAPDPLPLRVAVLLAGVLLNGVATGLYIAAGLGPGPRDGLMTGLAARGHSIRVVRTAIELSVLAAGWLLGGSVGAGTVVYALAIGPLAHVFLPLFRLSPAPGPLSDAAGPLGGAAAPAGALSGAGAPAGPRRPGPRPRRWPGTARRA